MDSILHPILRTLIKNIKQKYFIMIKNIILSVHKASVCFGHAGGYVSGEHMAKVVNYFLVTTKGKVPIDAIALKAAANLSKMPTEAVLNKKLVGKGISAGGNLARQLAKFL